MTDHDRRKIELEFYITINALYSIKQDANFLANQLEGLRFIVDFDLDLIIRYANDFNLNPEWRPYYGELIGFLYKYSDIPVGLLCKACGVSRPTGYKYIEKFLQEECTAKPKVPIPHLPELQKCNEAFKKYIGGIKRVF